MYEQSMAKSSNSSNLSYNPEQNIWNKLKKYSKIGQDLKNLIYNFGCFLTAIVNV